VLQGATTTIATTTIAIIIVVVGWLVGRSLTSLFSTNTAVSETIIVVVIITIITIINVFGFRLPLLPLPLNVHYVGLTLLLSVYVSVPHHSLLLSRLSTGHAETIRHEEIT